MFNRSILCVLLLCSISYGQDPCPNGNCPIRSTLRAVVSAPFNFLADGYSQSGRYSQASSGGISGSYSQAGSGSTGYSTRGYGSSGSASGGSTGSYNQSGGSTGSYRQSSGGSAGSYSGSALQPNTHAHQMMDGGVLVHSDSNMGNAAAHAGVAYPWVRIGEGTKTRRTPFRLFRR